MANDLDKPERFKLGEIGYSGQRMFNGISLEESHRDLTHPLNIQTYRAMSYHPAINAALSLYQSMVSKATFVIEEPKDANEEEKNRTELVKQMFDDMDVSMEDVIVDILSMTTFGFSVLEKVYRRRLKSKGSAYNDGIIAPKKLALRNQESIERFIFDDSGNELIGVKQNLSRVKDPANRFSNRSTLEVILPREKFMLFSLGRNRSNPYGTSPLRDVYLPWKYLSTVEELEASGVAKDLQGLPVLYIPAEYMSADASDEQKSIFEQFKSIIRNLQQNTQSGIILPSTTDPETRAKLFEIDLLSTEGGKKNYDTNDVKEYYRTMIFIGMAADILLMGNTQTGSFALGAIKTSLTGSFVESILKRVVQVFNEDLIKQIYDLNGWDVTRRCKMNYEDFEDVDLETFSTAVQRIGAVGYLPKTKEVIDKILSSMNMEELPEDANLDELLPDNQSKSGQGMEEGMNNGTGKSTGNSGDASASNANNKG